MSSKLRTGTWKHLASLGAMALLAGCATAPAKLQPAASPAVVAAAEQKIDAFFKANGPATPGCSLGVAQNGKRLISRAVGSADLERNLPITADTVFDIGSLQKQFVAASILLLVQDGKLSLTEDVRRYLPELPDYGHKLTLDHLLTHTSGLRDWTALLPLASDKPEALTAILRQRGVNFAPGEEWAYSNSNFVLLKEIVARTSGKPFAEFARTRLFEPLGMKASFYSVDMRGDTKNRAVGYEKQGEAWRVSMRLDNDRGGGGILSTTGDMLIWNEALTHKRLGSFVTSKLQETAKLNNGRALEYARGLIVDPDTGANLIWHSGGSAGYNAWLGRYPDYGLSIAFACNLDVDGSRLAGEIIEEFLPASVTANATAVVPAPAPNTPPDPAVTARAGFYVEDGGEELMRLGIDRGALRIAGGPPLVADGDSFRPRRPDMFFRSQDRFEMRFTAPDAFELKSMEGKTVRYRRAEPWTPAAAELQAFVGAYESKELQAVFDVTPSANGLEVRLRHDAQRVLQVRPILRDTFQIGNVTFRFRRDAAGKVTAIDYSNPVIRSVRLARLDG